MDLGLDLEPLVRVASEPIRKSIQHSVGQNEGFLVVKGKIRGYRSHGMMNFSFTYSLPCGFHKQKCEVEEKGDLRRALVFLKRVVGRMWRFCPTACRPCVSMRPRVVPLCYPNSFEKCCNSRRQGPPLSAYRSYCTVQK